MKAIPVILIGKGTVGRAFLDLLIEKRSVYQEKYNLDFFLQGIFRSKGGAFWSQQAARQAFFIPMSDLNRRITGSRGLIFLSFLWRNIPLE